MEYEISFEREGETRQSSFPPAKYPHAKEVFRFFGAYPLPWLVNRQMLLAAEWLYTEKGMEELTDLFKFYDQHHQDKFCPKFTNPMELVIKYPKLMEYAQRF